MKMNKILVAGLLASIATSAFAAQVNIRITGSTAYRSATNTSILGLLTNKKIAYANGSGVTSLSSANEVTYTGSYGGKTVRIQAHWSGSDEGLRAVASVVRPSINTWIPEDTALNFGSDTGAQVLTTSYTPESAAAEVAMADNTQIEAGLTSSGFTTLTQTAVGVIPFVWVKAPTSNPAVVPGLEKMTNITSYQARSVLGLAPLSFFSNNKNDLYPVYVFGRDIGSGTRLNALVECGYGRDTPPVQYTATISSGVITDAVENANPSLGYTSGGSVKTVMGSTVAADKEFVAIAYLGVADAQTTIGSTFNATTGAFTSTNVLSFNGVPFSYDAVRNGSYAFWNYEYISYGALTADQTTFIADLTAALTANTPSGSIKLSTMEVERPASGQLINSLIF